MKLVKALFAKEPILPAVVFLLLITSFLVLRSIAPFVFPVYFIYFALAIFAFIVFSQIDFEVLGIFYKQIYILCIILLIIPLIIGQVTRGTIRWIPIGPLAFQPSEIVRPFLLLFFAKFLSERQVNWKRFFHSLMLLALPLFLILIQPSLGVTVLTGIGFLGVLFASGFSKQKLAVFLAVGLVISPIIWLGLADYQKARVLNFFSPTADPSGSGYNSMQAMISVGSGKLLGRGLGEGVQTQLSFLPERHTDFIFASVAEELGFLGSIFLLTLSFMLLYRVISCIGKSQDLVARTFISGMFLTLFAQTMVHIGMNMGIFPITGVPLPLVSAGGSSLLATMITLGIVISAVK